MANTNKLTDTAIEQALIAARGLKTEAASILDCGISTVHRRIKQSARLQQVVSDQEERALDLAEQQLREAVALGRKWAIEFTLRYKGRERGYTDTRQVIPPTRPMIFKYQQVAVQAGGTINIRSGRGGKLVSALTDAAREVAGGDEDDASQ